MPRILSLSSLPHTRSLFLHPKSTVFNLSLPMSPPISSRKCYNVPGITAEEVSGASEEAFRRHLNPNLSRNGSGVVIVWFRNDLRVLDNEALIRAWAASEFVLPVYCLDPRLSGTTHYFGFPKTGAIRAKFLLECVSDLKRSLLSKGLDLLVRHGKPEDIIPSLAKACSAHTVKSHCISVDIDSAASWNALLLFIVARNGSINRPPATNSSIDSIIETPIYAGSSQRKYRRPVSLEPYLTPGECLVPAYPLGFLHWPKTGF